VPTGSGYRIFVYYRASSGDPWGLYGMSGGTVDVAAGEPANLTLTVSFDAYQYVVAPGVTLERVQTNVTPNITTMQTPDSPPGAIPNATSPTVRFSNLAGGPNYTYTVSCKSSKASCTLVAPPFRLLANGNIRFDTYPGGG
jgi:hypothetical protein